MGPSWGRAHKGSPKSENTMLLAICISTLQKHVVFAIGNSKNTIKHEALEWQKRRNAIQGKSKRCFSFPGRSPRPPAIDFLMLSGSSWARNRSKLRKNIAPGGTRERNSSKTLRFIANRRHPKDGPETIIIHNSLVQYAFGGATSLTKPYKSSYRARSLL